MQGAERGDVRPYGVAGKHAHLLREAGAHGGLVPGEAHALHHSAENAVGRARYGVLFVQGGGASHEAGRKHGGEGRVAAEAHDGVGREAAHDAHGPHDARGHGEHGCDGPGAAADEAAHGQTFKGHACTLHDVSLRAVLAAHEKNLYVGPTLSEGLDDGKGGEDVSAGASGGDDDAKGHAYSRAVRE